MASIPCKNCGKIHTCLCTMKTASDGSHVCKICLSPYQVKINNPQPSPNNLSGQAPIINSVNVQYNNFNK